MPGTLAQPPVNPAQPTRKQEMAVIGRIFLAAGMDTASMRAQAPREPLYGEMADALEAPALSAVP